jgi:hypothetical protein
VQKRAEFNVLALDMYQTIAQDRMSFLQATIPGESKMCGKLSFRYVIFAGSTTNNV